MLVKSTSADIATIESISSQEHFDDISLQEATDEARKQEQRNTEILAAIRCKPLLLKACSKKLHHLIFENIYCVLLKRCSFLEQKS